MKPRRSPATPYRTWKLLAKWKMFVTRTAAVMPSLVNAATQRLGLKVQKQVGILKMSRVNWGRRAIGMNRTTNSRRSTLISGHTGTWFCAYNLSRTQWWTEESCSISATSASRRAASRPTSISLASCSNRTTASQDYQRLLTSCMI